MNQALVVVDAQNEFSSTGLRPVPNHATALSVILEHVASARLSAKQDCSQACEKSTTGPEPGRLRRGALFQKAVPGREHHAAGERNPEPAV